MPRSRDPRCPAASVTGQQVRETGARGAGAGPTVFPHSLLSWRSGQGAWQSCPCRELTRTTLTPEGRSDSSYGGGSLVTVHPQCTLCPPLRPPPPPLWAPIPPRDSGFLSVRPAQDGDSRPGGHVCLHLDWAGAAEGRVGAGAYWSRRDPGGKLPLYLVVPPTGVSQALVQTSCTSVKPNHTLPHVQSWHEPHANPQK